MTNAISLISSAQPAPTPPPIGAVRKDAGGFSYDDAVSALERKASRAIDAHGGEPGRTATAAAANSERAGPLQAASGQAGRKAPTDVRPAETPVAEAGRPSTETASLTPTVVAQISGVNATAAGSPSSPSGVAPAANSAVAAVRDAAVRIRTDAPRAPIIGQQPAPTVRHFAEILAQRLDKASQFDLRLDPPALGQIDGRLTLADDGHAVLALAFDNQSAFDLFSRDEQALRQALADAGFSLGSGDLQFRFQPPEPTGDDARTFTAAATGQPPAFISPAAPHSGAIDIRA